MFFLFKQRETVANLREQIQVIKDKHRDEINKINAEHDDQMKILLRTQENLAKALVDLTKFINKDS